MLSHEDWNYAMNKIKQNSFNLGVLAEKTKHNPTTDTVCGNHGSFTLACLENYILRFGGQRVPQAMGQVWLDSHTITKLKLLLLNWDT